MWMSWFPLAEDLTESPEFKKLTPTEKLFTLLLISKFNERGPFYLPDLEAAVTLRTSTKTIQRARKKLGTLNWIDFRPGFLDRYFRGVATLYMSVKFADPSEVIWFAQMPRFTFEALLFSLFNGTLEHKDIMTYVALTYLYWRMRGSYADNKEFFVTKTRLRELTGIYDAPARAEWLSKTLKFSSGKSWFTCVVSGQRLIVREWDVPADSAKDERNRQILEAYRQRVMEEVRTLKERFAEAVEAVC